MAEIIEESLPGVKALKLRSHVDERGFFAETYRVSGYRDLGIEVPFVQDNHSFSKKGVIRGMHFQLGQAKLVTVVVGTIYDVFVDIQKDSPNYGKWGARLLDAKEGDQLFIPDGYAHGFAALSDVAHVIYKVSTEFNPDAERSFRYDDPEVGIAWPIKDPILSEKDRGARNLKEVLSESLDSWRRGATR